MRKYLVSIIDLLLRIFIGGVFILSGISKLLDIPAFAKVVHEFDILPDLLVTPFSVALPIVELAAGLLVVLGLFVRPALIFIMMMLVAFIAVIIPNLGGENVISECGCFGGLLKSTININLLIRDIVFLLITLVIYYLKENNFYFNNFTLGRL